MTTIYTSKLDSPLGTLFLAHANNTLYALDFQEFQPRFDAQLAKRFPQVNIEPGQISPMLQQQLTAYFDGDIHILSDILVHMHGTPFQQQVWQGLRAIPAGKTSSYQQLAQAIGNTKAQRAVGAANGKNPMPLVVPCHRVISANGTIGGYSGALWRKEWLLKHEHAVIPA